MEELEDGQILAIRMNDGEPVRNVPRSIKEEGHQILKLDEKEREHFPATVIKENNVVEFLYFMGGGEE